LACAEINKFSPYGGVGDFDFDFKILTALKGWVGHAPQGRGALHIHNYRHYALQPCMAGSATCRAGKG